MAQHVVYFVMLRTKVRIVVKPFKIDQFEVKNCELWLTMLFLNNICNMGWPESPLGSVQLVVWSTYSPVHFSSVWDQMFRTVPARTEAYKISIRPVVWPKKIWKFPKWTILKSTKILSFRSKPVIGTIFRNGTIHIIWFQERLAPTSLNRSDETLMWRILGRSLIYYWRALSHLM